LNLKDDVKTIFFHFGAHCQKNKIIEELSELIIAVTKNDRKNIVEEIADVEIMLLQLKIMFGIEKYEIDNVKEIKIEKVLQFIRKVKYER
jgi:phosphoribosyl-ATP pyrophosphohydrolase